MVWTYFRGIINVENQELKKYSSRDFGANYAAFMTSLPGTSMEKVFAEEEEATVVWLACSLDVEKKPWWWQINQMNEITWRLEPSVKISCVSDWLQVKDRNITDQLLVKDEEMDQVQRK